MKRKTSAPSTWIAEHLNMGAPQLIGVYVNRLHRELEPQPNPDYDEFISIHTQCPLFGCLDEKLEDDDS